MKTGNWLVYSGFLLPQIVFLLPRKVFLLPQIAFSFPQIVFWSPRIIFLLPQIVFLALRIVFLLPQIVFLLPRFRNCPPQLIFQPLTNGILQFAVTVGAVFPKHHPGQPFAFQVLHFKLNRLCIFIRNENPLFSIP